jgi:hypothetical protein
VSSTCMLAMMVRYGVDTMTLGTLDTTKQAINSLLFLRSHAMYRYGGIWHVACINRIGYAYRNKRDLFKQASKAGLQSIEFATLK